jgi:regulator of sigma E protease
MAFFSLLVILVILNIVYVIGFLSAQVVRKSPQHYFLGFNPGFATLSFRNVKFTLGIYIPIIGFARIYYVDNVGKKQLFYPWQLVHTPLFQRLLLTYSGVVALFFFGGILAIISVYTSSDQYIPKAEVIKHGIYPSVQARTVGFLPGDKVVAVNGRDYNDFAELVRPETIYSAQTNYTILRDGQELILSLTDSSRQNLPPHELFLTINAPFFVGEVQPQSPAEKAGILSGDKIVKVNGHPIITFQEMNSYFQSDEDGEVVLEIRRGNDLGQKFEKIVALNQYNKIGISIDQKIEYETEVYSFIESVKLGTARFWSGIVVQFKVFGRTLNLLAGREKQTLRGPISISAAFGSFSFPWFASFTSMYVAVIIALNFLPLPKSAMLEVIPLGYEAITRRSLSYKSFRLIRQISIWLLVLMMVWQLVIDIGKLF